MSGLAETAPGTPASPSGPAGGDGTPGRLARVWAVPLGVHVVALAGVLVLGLFLIGPRVGYSSDEGAAVLQAHLLDHDGTWLYRYPLAGIDPGDEARPFVRGDLGSDGLAPYAKHPLYPLVLAGADRLGDPIGMWMLTVAGTVGAAAMAALLARRLSAGLARPTLWIVGIGSPLVFDAYFVLAHSLAAFAVAAAVLLVLVALEPRRGRAGRVLVLLAAAVLLAVAAMLRTEALFLGPALAVGLVGLAALRRVSRPWAAVAVVAVLGGEVLAWSIDHLALRWIVGTPIAGAGDVPPSSWLAGRWQSLDTTWFRASYSGERIGDFAVFLAAGLLVVAAVSLRIRRPTRDLAVITSLAAVVCLAVRLGFGATGVIAGLALAFPIGWAGLWSIRRSSLDGVTSFLLTVTAALVTGAVLLTQYARGGGIEWGGRYFAVVIAVASPVLVQALVVAVQARPPDRMMRWAPVVAVGLVVLPALIALQALRHAHDATDRTMAAMRAAAAVAGVDPGRSRVVILSDNRLLPQIAYRDFDRYDWVVPDQLGPFADRLAELGVDRVVLVSPDTATDLAALPGWHVVGQPPTDLPIDVAVIERDPAAN